MRQKLCFVAFCVLCFTIANQAYCTYVNISKPSDHSGLKGTIPSEISALSSLDWFSVLASKLHGTIPSSMGSLPNLRFIQLAYSNITGTIPESFSNLRKLWLFALGGNEYLTGTIPQGLFQLPSMEIFNVYNSSLSGPIPESNPNEPQEKFKWIEMSYNKFTGTIPESIYLPSMEQFFVGGNRLTGTISSHIGNFQDMLYFDVASNNLTGTIPTEIGLMHSLEKLHLTSNFFVGEIPTELGLVNRLDELWLDSNRFAGVVPVELSSLSAGDIRLQFNDLTGDLNMLCVDDVSSPLTFSQIHADCAAGEEDSAKIDCPCCTKCCNSDSGDCESSYANVCRQDMLSYEHVNGPNYVDQAGTICDCPGEGQDITLTCSEECESCTLDGTVCAITEEYHIEYDDNGEQSFYRAVFQYVKGISDTVTFELRNDGECLVIVNGEECDACEGFWCGDGFASFRVGCNNLGYGDVSLCDGKGGNVDGPLAVFAFQDPAYVSGCAPRIPVPSY